MQSLDANEGKRKVPFFSLFYSLLAGDAAAAGNYERVDESEEIHSIIRFLPITAAECIRPTHYAAARVHKHLVVHARAAIKGPRKSRRWGRDLHQERINNSAVCCTLSKLICLLSRRWWDLDLSECAQSPSSSYRRTSVSLKNRERGIAVKLRWSHRIFQCLFCSVSSSGALLMEADDCILGCISRGLNQFLFQRTNLGLSEKKNPNNLSLLRACE